MKGAWRIGRWQGVPVYVHWTTPLGLFVFTGFSIQPVAWLVLLGLILMHEQGHAFLARRAGLEVHAIVLQGNGGECAIIGYPTSLDHAIIAWGGVLGQIPGLILGLLLLAVVPPTAPAPLLEVVATLVEINLVIIGLNLLPLPPLDGWHAWRLFSPENLGAMGRRVKSRWLRARLRAIERKLDEIKSRRGRR